MLVTQPNGSSTQMWVDAGSAPGVSPGNERIFALADDLSGASNTPAPNVATRIASAINNSLGPDVVATRTNQFVRLNKGRAFADPPIITAGEGPGGSITGLTIHNGQMYAVSDQGGFYRVVNPTTASATAVYIDSSANDLTGIQFGGLTTAPSNVEGGRYANMLFAIDTNGRMFAFNTPTQNVIPGRNEVQRLGIADATGGTFTISWRGETTAPILYIDPANNNALVTGAQVETALEGLRGINAGDIRVTPQGRSSSWTIEFISPSCAGIPNCPAVNPPVGGAYEQQDLPEFQMDGAGLQGNATTLVRTLIQGRARQDLSDVSLQPIFLDGATSVTTGVSNANGLAFSALDSNLFHFTPDTTAPRIIPATAMDVRLGLAGQVGQAITVDDQQNALGHGINPTFDGSRDRIPGLSSLSFSQGNVGGAPRTYDFAGGAHGTVISNDFDLSTYSAADRPVLYFNYFLETEAVNFPVPRPAPDMYMRDSFRVFIADNSGDWQLLSTNNVNPANNQPYEQNADVLSPFDVQPVFDTRATPGADWRQVRVPLDAYAGRDNLRLRFDFSTAADMNVGDILLSERNTTGSELRTVGGVYLRDGQTFQIDSQVFEIESGFTMVTPTGSQIPVQGDATFPAGETFAITDEEGNTQLFRFVSSQTFPPNIIVRDGQRFIDGDVFDLSDGTSTVSFEFDTGFVVQIPAVGADELNGGIADGDMFVVDDGVNPVVYEFDKDDMSLPGNKVINITDDLTLLVPTQFGINRIADGDRFEVSDGTSTVTFEFDSNGVADPANAIINIRDNFVLQVPVEGGRSGGIVDSETFTILFDDGTNPPNSVTFEFDSNGVFVDNAPADGNPDNVRIIFDTFATQSDMIALISQAIDGAGLGLTAVDIGNGEILLEGTSPFHSVDVFGTQFLGLNVLTITQDQISDRIVAAVGGQSLGLTPVNLLGGTVVLGSTTPLHTLNAGGSINLGQTTTPRTQADIVNRIVAEVRAQQGSTVTPTDVGNGQVQFGGQLSHTVDTSVTMVAQSLLPAYTLQVPVGGGTAILDGESFSISEGLNPPVIFEFDSGGGVVPGVRRIAFTPTDTPEVLADAIVAEITAANLFPAPPMHMGSGSIFLGGTLTKDVTVDLMASMTSTGTPSASLVGVATNPSGTTQIIDLTLIDTAQTLSARIAKSILNSPLNGITSVTVSDTLVQVAGTNISFNPRLSPLDVQDFTPIFVEDQQTPADVAERIAQAIRAAFDPFGTNSPTVVPHLGSDANLDGNRVNLSGAVNVTLGLGANSAIVLDGSVGVTPGNVPLPVHSDMSRLDVANVLDPVLEDQFRNKILVTQNGLGIYDGDTFVLGDGIGAPVTFEFDSGFLLKLPTDGGKTIADSNQPNPQGIKDGDYFTLTNGSVTVTFEFDKDQVPTIRPGNVRIPQSNGSKIEEASTALGIAKEIVASINASPISGVLGINPVAMPGGLVRLGGLLDVQLIISPGSTLSQGPSTPFLLDIPTAGGDVVAGGVQDGATLEIRHGTDQVVFEFDKDLSISPGNVRVPISSNSSQAQVAQALVTAIQGISTLLATDLGIDRTNTRVLPNGERVLVAGTPRAEIRISEGSNVSLVLPEPGTSPPIAIQTPETLSLQLPELLTLHIPQAGGGTGGIVDGETFTISLAGFGTETFEFESDGTFADLDGDGAPDNTLIFFTPLDSADDIAMAVRDQIDLASATLNLFPTKLGNAGNIDLGGTRDVVALPVASSLTRTGPFAIQAPLSGGANILDGETFEITTSSATIIFEFDNDSTTLIDNVAIPFTAGQTQVQIAQAIIDAINGVPGLDLMPVSLAGPARVHLGGGAGHTVNTDRTHLTQTGQSGTILDGDLFFVTDGTDVVTFEFDSDNSALPGNHRLEFTTDSTLDQLVAEVITQLNIAGPTMTGLGITPRHLGGGEIHLGGDTNIRLDTDLIASITQSGVGGPIADGETFMITLNGNVTIFEFDNDGTFVDVDQDNNPDNQLVGFTFDDTQGELASAIKTSLEGAALSLFPRVTSDGLIDLGATPSHILNTTDTANLGQVGIAFTPVGVGGGQIPHVPVLFAPSAAFTASDVAQAVQTAINVTAPNLAIQLDVNASIFSTDTRRVQLTHTTGFPTDVDFNSPIAGAFQLGGTPPVELFQVFDVVKQDDDLIRIIGHTVVDPGPLGYDAHLQGDDFGDFNNFRPVPSQRGIDNQHEGLYIDDIIIGFAERGEMATDAISNSTFIGNPLQAGQQILQGPYQLEIRKATDFGTPLIRSFDTNDRLSQGITLLAQPGSHIYDGQTFVISDGINAVTFEYESITANNGVVSGHQVIPFDPSSPDYIVARTIRDAINGAEVQAVLPELSAVLGDGTIVGNGNPTTSTSARVNLFGPAHLSIHGFNIIETNDTLSEATPTNIVGRNSPSFLGSGFIGDNPGFPLKTGFDVDLFHLQLERGESVRIDVDADEIGSELDSSLRVFDINGMQLAFSDDDQAPGEFVRLDPFLQFVAPETGDYFVGVSAFNNASYDPNVEGSGNNGQTGFYQIEITFGAASRADFLLFDDKGDSNLERDQGQILIHSNRIANSASFGIVVDAGPRDGGTNSDGEVNSTPHMGPVRNLFELNTDNLATSVVIENNVLFGNQLGAIRFSGETRPAGGQVGSVPFGRIINNTLFGIGGSLAPTGTVDVGILVDDFAAPTILNNIIANFDTGIRVVQDGVSEIQTIVGGQLYQGNSTSNITGVSSQDFAIALGNPDPTALPNGPNCITDLHDPNALFVNPAAENFYLLPCSRAIDSSIGSLLDRSGFVRVKDPVGIGPSPILAPNTDVTGQLRADDPNVETPSGFGDEVFIDRGGIDRADFAGPTASLVTPVDNDADGIDLRPDALTVVQLGAGIISSNFEIRLVDGVEPADPNDGIGIDDTTVVSQALTITRDGVLLKDGIDYTFSYNRTSDTIRLTPLSGIWTPDSVYVMALNNQDRFLVTAPSGDQIIDGDAFIVTDLSGVQERFEFESGYTLQVPQTVTIQVPAAGGRLGGIRDGETFTVNFDDGMTTRTAKFEFDKNNLLNGANLPILFDNTSTQNEIAFAIVNAIANSGIGLNPVNLGRGQIHLGTTSSHSLFLPASGAEQSSLTSTGVSAGIADGQTFSISDGNDVVRFEFDSDGIVFPETRVIPFSTANTHIEIAGFIVAAITQAVADGTLSDANQALTMDNLGNGLIHLRGARVHELRSSLSSLIQAGNPGVTQPFGLQIPGASLRIQTPGAGLHMLVPFAGGGAINDGDSFTITNQLGENRDPMTGARPTATYEFDSDGLITPGNVAISFTASSNQAAVADAIVTTLTTSILNLAPAHLSSGDIDLRTVDFLVDLGNSPGLTQTGISDGQVFTVDDGIRLTRFEFDSESAPGDVAPGNIRLPFTDQDLPENIAATIVVALNSASIDLHPLLLAFNLGNGRIDAGDPATGGQQHLWNTNLSNLIQTGESGGIRDGETFDVFLLDNMGFEINRVTFEFDNIRDGNQTLGNTVIVFADTSTAAAIGDSVVPVLLTAGLNLAPSHLGLGSVDLGGTANHGIDLLTSPVFSHLRQIGTAGEAAAVAVPFIPSAAFDATQMVVSIRQSINGNQRSGASVTLATSERIYIDDASRVTGVGRIFDGTVGSSRFVGAIKDQATNPLKPNQLSGETQFTVMLGDVVLDYGDAADPLYATLASSNGAAHVLRDGPILGSRIDGETDGNPSPNANGDDGDAFIDLFLSQNSLQAENASPPFIVQLPTAIQIPALGAASGGIADGDTITIGDSRRIVTFEFDSDDNISPSNVAIDITQSGLTQNEIANAIVAAVEAERFSIAANNAGGGRVIFGLTGNDTLDISGSPVITKIAGVTAGDTFSIAGNPSGSPVVFEFDDLGDLQPVQSGNVAIPYTVSSTINQIAVNVVAAVRSVTPPTLVGLNPINLGNGAIDLGGHFVHEVDATSSSLSVAGVAPFEILAPGTGQALQVPAGVLEVVASVFGGRAIQEGEHFTVHSGSAKVTFEFTSDATVQPGRLPLNYSQTDDQDTIGNAIVTAIVNSPTLALTPIYLGNGIVRIGDIPYGVDTSASSITTSNVAPFVLQSPPLGGFTVLDGEKFTIRKGANAPVVFEFDNNGIIDTGSVRVSYTFFSTQDDVAASIARAIRDEGSLDLVTEDLGGGAVLLREPVAQIDLSQSPGITQTGLSDGQVFTVDDGDRIVTFEFDSNGLHTNGNPVISINDNYRLQVAASGGGVNGIADGDLFSVRNVATNQFEVFEFDKNNVFIDINLDTLPDFHLIPISDLSTREQVAAQIVAALEATNLDVAPLNLGGGIVLLENTSPHVTLDTTGSPNLSVGTQPRTLDEISQLVVNSLQATSLVPALSPRYLGNGVIEPGQSDNHVISTSGSNIDIFGDPGAVIDGQTIVVGDGGTVKTFEFDFDGRTATGTVPIRLNYNFTIQVPAAGGAAGGVQDGDRFAVNLGIGSPDTIFEFDSDGNADAGSTVITFTELDDQDELAVLINNALNVAFPRTPIPYSSNLGNGRVLLDLDGTLSENLVDTSGSQTLSHFLNDDVATRVFDAIRQGGFSTDVTVTNLGDGRIHIDGGTSHDLDISLSGLLSPGQLPTALRASAGTNIIDGDSFVVGDGNRTVTFEFDETSAANGVAQGSVAIPFASTDGRDQVASAVVAAITSQNLSITATALATGLIHLDGDDEDGVSFSGGLIQGTDTEVVVTASAPGLLDAWIDFNQDGDFNDVNEQVFSSRPLAAGANILTFATPTNVPLGTSTARFRLSSLGGLRPTGLAADGEVEDYSISIITNVPPTVANPIPTVNVDEDAPDTIIDLSNVFADPDITNGNSDRLRLRVVGNTNPSLLNTSLAQTGTQLTLDYLRYQNGSADITIEATDQGGETVRTTFRVNVAPVNNPPEVVASLGAMGFVTVNEDAPDTTVDMSIAFDDVDILTNNDFLTFTFTNDNPALVVATVVDASPNIDTMILLQFQENANSVADGDARIRVVATDQAGAIATATLTVVVNAVNDAPTPNDDSTSTSEDSPILPSNFNVLTFAPADTDPDGDALTIVGVNGTNNLIGTSVNGAFVELDDEGRLTYDPTDAPTLQALSENSTPIMDTFRYTVSDGELQSEATVTIEVTGLNDVPVAVDDQATTDKNVTVDISVLTNDTDAEDDNLFVTRIGNSVAPVGQPIPLTSGAMVTRNADNSLTYDPFGRFDFLNSGESATDTFNYTIDDGHSVTSTALVTVTILGPNTPPTAVNDNATTDEETSITINVLLNDDDFDGQAIRLVGIDVTSLNTRGKVIVSGNSVIYDPNDQFETLAFGGPQGIDKFTYRIADTQGGEAVGTVTVTINGVNDPPIGVNDGYNVLQGSRLTVLDHDGSLTPTNILDNGLLVNDIDIDGDTLVATKLADPLNGTLIVNADGTFSYTHDGGLSTSDVFTYEVSDGNGGADTVTVNLTIVPRPPSIWQNPDNRFDVNADGFCTPIDALLLINRLNLLGPGELPNPAIPPNAPPPFYDVNGDGLLTSTGDILQVINKLNQQVVGEGEASPNPGLLAEGEANQIIAMPTNSAHYGAAVWSLTQAELAVPALQQRASSSGQAAANSLVEAVQSYQRAALVDDFFGEDEFNVTSDGSDLEEENGDDFGQVVDTLFDDDLSNLGRFE
jgi:VCBS repeat-containing protein